jgi:redox-sensitive bicupin YhaK (pirin superfamily)
VATRSFELAVVECESVKWLDTTPPSEPDNRALVLFDSGDEVVVQAGDDGIRFLLVSGKPVKEPVAWYEPIVMNTQEQLQQAFEELRYGTCLNTSKVVPASDLLNHHQSTDPARN